MWALLVLTFGLAAGALESSNKTAAEERLVIARAKLMVSGTKKIEHTDNFEKSPRFIFQQKVSTKDFAKYLAENVLN